MRNSIVFGVIVAALGFAPLGSTARAAKRMAVLSTEPASPRDGSVQAKIVRALKHNKIHVVSGAVVKKAVKSAGLPSSDGDWVSLARTLKVDGIVGYSVARRGANRRVDLVMRNGADGSVAGEDSTTTKALPKRVGGFISASLAKSDSGPSGPPTVVAQEKTSDPLGLGSVPDKLPPPIIEKAPAPPSAAMAAASKESQTTAPAPFPAPGAPPASSEDEADGPGAAGVVSRQAGRPLVTGAVGRLSTYEIELDARAVRRTFDYSPGSIPQRYTLNFNPMVGGRASWYPIRNAGVFAQGEFGAGLETGSYPTGTREIIGGAQGRLPLDFGQVNVSASYFHHAFLIQDTSATNDAPRLTLPIPNTVYQGVRLAAGARVNVTPRVRVTADVAYRLVASIGQDLGEVRSAGFFPGASKPWGLDGNASVGVGLTSMFELRAGIDYRRYSYGTLNGTVLGGTRIDASGAADQYIAASLGVAAVLN